MRTARRSSFALIGLWLMLLSPTLSGLAAPDAAPKPPLDEQLRQAAFQGDLTRIQTLLAQGANINAVDLERGNALVSAANGGQTRVVVFLLRHGASAKDSQGREALFTAVQEGQTQMVKALLGRGANVNARDIDGSTPLMQACYYDTGGEGFGQSPALVKLLLASGADAHAQDENGKTALAYLKQHLNRPILKMLRQAGETK